MDRELLTRFLELQSKLLFISFTIYEKKFCVFATHPVETNCDMVKAWLEEIPKKEEAPSYILTKELLLFGRIPLCGTESAIIAGPVSIAPVNEKQIHSIILSSKSVLQPSDSNEIFNYIEYVSRNISIDKFLPMLGHLFEFVNQKPLCGTEIYGSFGTFGSLKALLQNSGKDMALEDQKHLYAEKPRHSSYRFEKELLFYVSHGMPEKLSAMSMNYGEFPSLAGEPIRHYKNALIILNSLCQRAAIVGGIDPETCYQLGEVYIHRIEACKNVDELNALSGLVMDYSSRVAEAVHPRAQSEKIAKAMHYIKINYPKKLTVGMIAEHVGLSKEYLSSRFHKELNITLPDFINKQKITEAKRLLLFSDLTLSQIADFLSFSSQSYFQSVFKKMTGITPSEYRRNKNGEII